MTAPAHRLVSSAESGPRERSPVDGTWTATDAAGGTHDRARHPGDGLRVGLAVVLLVVSLAAVRRDHLTLFERDVFRLLNDLPSAVAPVLLSVMQLGSLAAVPTAAVAFLLLRRGRRLPVDALVSGTVAWFAAKAVKRLVERPRPGRLLPDMERLSDAAGLGFVSGHTAVAAALATAAAPYLPRRWRRVAWALVWTVGAARVFDGAHLPLDIVGGVAVGWAVGAAWHVALGAPHRRPTVEGARTALRGIGIEALDVVPVTVDAQGSFPFTATVGERRIFVKMLDPEPRDRDLLFRLGRFVAVREVRDEARLRDALQQAEHEAAMTLLARAAGVRAPTILRVQRAGDVAWLVEDHVGDLSLATGAAADLQDDVLDDAWRQVRVLHDAGLAHRDLLPDNVIVDASGATWIVDFAHAVSGAEDRAADNDVAEFLVGMAGIVGPERAVRSAARILGRDALRDALPELQPLALTGVCRRRLRATPDLLDRLRVTIGLPQPDEPPRSRPLHRWVDVVGSLAVAVTLAAIGGVGAVRDSIVTGSWRWLVIAVGAAAVARLAEATAIVAASGRSLGVLRTALACVLDVGADAASERAGVADHLVRSGIPWQDAETTVALTRRWPFWTSVAGLLVAIAATVASDVRLDVTPEVLVTVVVAGMLTLAAVPQRRRHRPMTSGPDGAHLTVVVVSTTLAMAAAVALVTAGIFAVGGRAPAAVIVVATLAALALGGPPRPVLGRSALWTTAVLAALGSPTSTAVAASLIVWVLQTGVPLMVGALGGARLRRRLVV